jgi:hypothetical protein
VPARSAARFSAPCEKYGGWDVFPFGIPRDRTERKRTGFVFVAWRAGFPAVPESQILSETAGAGTSGLIEQPAQTGMTVWGVFRPGTGLNLEIPERGDAAFPGGRT